MELRLNGPEEATLLSAINDALHAHESKEQELRQQAQENRALAAIYSDDNHFNEMADIYLRLARDRREKFGDLAAIKARIMGWDNV